jgi:DNA-binding MarR family transcriptional regulator
MDASLLRDRMRALVRALGVLDDSRTPCGVDLSVREAFALGSLLQAEAREPVSQSDVQRELGVDKSNVTRLVQRLVEAGRVEQRTGADGRVRTLHLTASGRRLAAKLEQRSHARFEAVLARIPRSERAGVTHALGVLEAALGQVAAATEKESDEA